MAVKRVYAHGSFYEDLCRELADQARQIVVGAGFEQGAKIGPLQNAAQYELAKKYLEIAHRDGNVIAGGEALDDGGYFVKPTVGRDIDHSSPLVSEEQFAPILPLIKFDDVDNALFMANDSRYGLGGSVWSGDVKRTTGAASCMVAGTVWVNNHCDLPVDVPLRGSKASGIGADDGIEGMLEI